MVSTRLRKQKGGGGYYSYVVTLPKVLVELLGWREGTKLKIEVLERNGKKGVFLYPEKEESAGVRGS